MANCFNNFFTNVGPTLAKSVHSPQNKSFTDYLQNNIASVFEFKLITPNELIEIINKLKPKSSFGHDNISTQLLKCIAPEIKNVLSQIINQSLSTGIFPNNLKIAKIVPIYKKEDPHLPDNYRPISLLPAISKVFEKVVFVQTYNYFVDQNLIYQSQYGFRSQHSTELAALELTDKIFTQLGIL